MKKRTSVLLARVLIAAAIMVLAVAPSVFAADEGGVDQARLEAAKAKVERNRITQEEREAAAARRDLLMRLSAVGASAAKTGGSSLAMAPLAAPMDPPGQGGIPDYFGSTPNWAYSPLLKKFVDTLPGLGPDNANNLGQYIPIAKPDTVTYPGSDYYEISLRQFSEQMHSDLPPTTLRGYVQTNNGTDANGDNTLEPDPIHYLGPFIIARKDRPVRIKFTNELPTGEAGDLFIPVDESVMGAGMGPVEGEMYTQNRATLHLHGGFSPWISDGTPHQWITPAGENTSYPKGVSVKNVPDMPDPGDGSMTFYYTNAQSARLMFYHDHSYGITRLNVYAGEAAGYMITDPAEEKLIADGTIPADQIPLIIQDKTFVDADTVLQTDPTWNWGTGTPDANGIRPPVTGDLWLPHVYVPAQNPADPSGMNATGRWHYSPWFWPPVTNIKYPPIPNPYYDPVNAPWEPPLMPATPNPSMGMEAFHDTPVVNGTAYPTLSVDPKAYRMRILNAANDRFFNLQMYVADPTVVTADGRTDTEVKMVPAIPTAGWPELWPTDGRAGGVPDPATAGPDWIQIGTEGGFLPKPAIIPQQPINWNTDPTTFNAGLVSDKSLLLGCAERADVVVDFSAYAGKTLILYNDAPAAFPALDPRMDYYTGAPDLTDTGGTVSPQAGFGPNTRTIMQIKVADTAPAAPYDLAKLQDAFTSTATKEGVFESSQNPIHIPDARYDSVYNKQFPADQWVRIFQSQHTFKTLDDRTITMDMEPKAIQDETSEVWDPEYGRMSGKLGLEMPRTNATNANFITYSFFDPVTENLQDSMTPLSPVGEDGTQIWKITHNGVDTHPIHFHLFDVQLINRVAWDNQVTPPDDNELGWKDTVRVNPLEDTIVALKPVAPEMTFGVPDSKRPLDPTQPIGGTMGFSNLDPQTGQLYPQPVTNEVTDFGWEYVWHCHILSHEEMDMMRPMRLDVVTSLPTSPSLEATGLPGSPIDLKWTDPTPIADPATFGNPANEIGFRIERADVDQNQVAGDWAVVGTALANQTTYTDSTTIDGKGYRYRVVAFNASGDVFSDFVSIAPPLYFNSYFITPTAGPNGTITPDTKQVVPQGQDRSFTIAANPGYHIADVVVDGVSQGAIADYTFTNVVADHTIAATFAINTYTITPTAGANGSITPATPQTVDHGADSPKFTIAADPGYHVADVLVDGVSQGPIADYTFTNVTADHTIEASFAINTYTITPTTGANGSISPATVQTVDHGADSAVFTITPNTGFQVLDVLVDGASVGAVTTYQFTNVTADHTIEAKFLNSPVVITPTAGPGGTITPGTAQSVPYGADSPKFTIAADPGYHIADVKVDGVSQGVITEYTFTNATTDHTIEASFAINTYTITPTAGANGAISPSTAQTVDHGADSAIFAITPNSGFQVLDVLVDGVSVGAVTTYQFTNVTADHTIEAKFVNNAVIITPTAGPGGTITPGVPQSVPYGTNSPVFTIAPNAGFYTASVLADGVSVGAVTSYQFLNAVTDHTLSASFETKVIGRFGSSVFTNAINAASYAYPGWTGVKDVVIASNDAQYDVPPAAALAGAYNGPLLLNAGGSLRSDVRNAIAAMPAGVKVHIVGGTATIPNGVVSALNAIPSVASVDRISGADRYDTAANVARRMEAVLGANFPTTALLVNGDISNAYGDAVAAGAVSARTKFPLLYVRSTALPTTTGAALFDLGLTTRYVIGGTAVVSESVRSAAGVPAANRLAGPDRAGTGVALANKAKSAGWVAATRVGFASRPQDANWAGAYLAKRNAPLLWVNSTSVPASTSGFLTTNAPSIIGGYVFGGTGQVSEPVRLQLLDLIK